jgi:hypothetical protein
MTRAILILLLTGVVLAFGLLLGGCANGGGLLQGSGVEAPAPAGFIDYCQRHPERAECGGTQ